MLYVTFFLIFCSSFFIPATMSLIKLFFFFGLSDGNILIDIDILTFVCRTWKYPPFTFSQIDLLSESMFENNLTSFCIQCNI